MVTQVHADLGALTASVRPFFLSEVWLPALQASSDVLWLQPGSRLLGKSVWEELGEVPLEADPFSLELLVLQLLPWVHARVVLQLHLSLAMSLPDPHPAGSWSSLIPHPWCSLTPCTGWFTCLKPREVLPLPVLGQGRHMHISLAFKMSSTGPCS